MDGPSTILVNTGTITGGNGGVAGAEGTGVLGIGSAPGQGGAGGVGILATGGMTLTNSGAISGGLGSGGSGDRANAITFLGGGTLELRAGSSINGKVDGNGASVFRLGGTVDSNFDLSLIGPSVQYHDFTRIREDGYQ